MTSRRSIERSRSKSQPDKELVRRWVGEVVDQGRLEAADEICVPELAERTTRWLAPSGPPSPTSTCGR